MAKQAWAPKEKKGETRKSYQKRYYSAQRTHAEETGDQKTTDKIYSKMGKKSHSVDSNAVDKGILGTVATGSLGKLGKLGALAKAGRGGEKAIGETKALGAGRQALSKGSRAASGGQKSLSGAKAGQKALSGSRVARSEGKVIKMGGRKAPGSQNEAIYERAGERGKVKGAGGKYSEPQSSTSMKNVTPKGRTSGVLSKGKTESYHTKGSSSIRPAAKSARSVANKKAGTSNVDGAQYNNATSVKKAKAA